MCTCMCVCMYVWVCMPVCAYVFVCVCVPYHSCRGQRTSLGVYSFLMIFENKTQVIRHFGECFYPPSHLASPLVTYFHTGIIKVISSDRTVSFKAPWPQIHGAISLLKCNETVLSTSRFNSLSSQNWKTRITSRHSGDWHGWLTGFGSEEVGFLIGNLDRPSLLSSQYI